MNERRFTLAGYVAYVTVFAVILLLAGLWLDAENRADNAPPPVRVETVQRRCVFYVDGSATCPPGVFSTSTTVTR